MSRRDDSANALLKLVLDRDEVPHDANVGGGVIDSHVADPLFRLTMPERAFRRQLLEQARLAPGMRILTG